LSSLDRPQLRTVLAKERQERAVDTRYDWLSFVEGQMRALAAITLSGLLVACKGDGTTSSTMPSASAMSVQPAASSSSDATSAKLEGDASSPSCASCTANALTDPHRFAWQLFAEINKTVPAQDPAKSNNVTWETWADNPTTFPPTPDPAHPPEFPRPTAATKALEVPALQSEIARRRGHTLVMPDGSEEVRRNRAAFDFIVDNKLFYSQGLDAAIHSGKAMEFPAQAIEVEGNWKPITEQDKAKYHWNRDAKGRLLGLVAMHVVTKALPNWLWATFEHVDNTARCEYDGCRDPFGMQRPDTPPASMGSCAAYAPGTLTPELLDLLNGAGLDPAWQNYRLKGIQTDFTDPMGRPTTLGNSVTEDGFLETSSCITCHARATTNGTENRNIGIFAVAPPPSDETSCADPPGGTARSYNGTPLPSWFFTGWRQTFFQTDFVWSFRRAKKAPSP
jgi:hypothetical protein